MSRVTRDRLIDLLRGLSIVLVLLHHFNIAYPLDDTVIARLGAWPAVHAVLRNGNYGVTIFFVISGYLITSTSKRRFGALANVRPAAFYRFRAARILPCVVLLLLIVNLLAAAGIPIFQNHPETGGPVALWMVDLASLTFWMNVLMAHAGWLNYVLCVQWSLSVEEVFYLAFPLICVLLRRERWLIGAWLIFVLAGPIWRASHQDDESGFLFAYLACFDGIAIGCCTALIAPHVALQGRAARAVQFAAAIAMATLYLSLSIGQSNVYGVTFIAFGTAVLIAAGAQRPVEPRRDGLGTLRACGRLSYELYLFHLLPLAALRLAWPPEGVTGNMKLALLALYLVASASLAASIARLYSNPFNRLLRGLGA